GRSRFAHRVLHGACRALPFSASSMGTMSAGGTLGPSWVDADVPGLVDVEVDGLGPIDLDDDAGFLRSREFLGDDEAEFLAPLVREELLVLLGGTPGGLCGRLGFGLHVTAGVLLGVVLRLAGDGGWLHAGDSHLMMADDDPVAGGLGGHH